MGNAVEILSQRDRERELSSLNSLMGPNAEDVALLATLSIKPWVGKLWQETHIGDVWPFSDQEGVLGETLIKIFVLCVPSQLYRFELTRKAKHGDGLENVAIVAEFCSSLSQIWPFVMDAVNENL